MYFIFSELYIGYGDFYKFCTNYEENISWLIANIYDHGTSHFWRGLYFNPKTFLLTLHDHHHYCKNIPSIFLASFKYEKMKRESCLPFTTYDIGTIAHVSNCLFNTQIWKKTFTIVLHFQPSNFQIIYSEKWI